MAADPHPKFTQEMFRIYQRARTEADYTATIFYGMLVKNCGLATAKTLINAPKPSDGYTALYERKKLNLTVEALVVEDARWHSLFTPSEIERARARLAEYGYTPTPRRH